MNSIKMGFLEKFKSPFNLKARPVLFGTRPHPEFLISSRTETSFRSVYLWEGRPQHNFYIFHIFSAIMTANTRKASGGGKVPKSMCFGCCVDIGKWSLASVWLVGRYDDQSSVACTIKLSIPSIIIHSLQQQQRQQTTWVNPDPCFACTQVQGPANMSHARICAYSINHWFVRILGLAALVVQSLTAALSSLSYLSSHSFGKVKQMRTFKFHKLIN